MPVDNMKAQSSSLSTHLRPLTAAVRVVGLASALLSSGVAALGLGDLKLYSAVNEPLRAEIRLLKVGDLDPNQVLVKLAGREDFERASVERDFFLTGMDYEVVLDGRGSGVVKITTDDPVREPYLNFLLEAKWPSGRLVREYTLLMDLPAFSSTETSGSSALQAASSSNTQAASSSIRSSSPAPSVAAPTPRPVQRAPSRVIASATPLQGDGYTVQRGDTLWEIAQQVKPGSSVTVNQTMLALQRENPNAFINDNINLLKSGHVLRVPGESRVREIANNQAQLEVARQTREWRGSDSVRQIDARARASEQAPAAGADKEGTLSLSSADGAGMSADAGETEANVEALQTRLNGVLDQLANSSSENEQLDERVQTLLSELEEMKNKLELRNSQLAQLQAQGTIDVADLEFDSVAATPEEMPIESIETDASEAEFAEARQDLNEFFEASEQDVSAADQDFLAETDLAETDLAAAEVIEAEQKPVPVAAKPEGFLDKLLSPAGLGGIAGVLALVAGLFFWRRRKAAEEEFELTEDDDFDDQPGMLAEEEVEAVEPSQQEEDLLDTQQARPQHASADGIEAEMGDPIAEADIYVAYGRYPQAIELLNRALEQDPDSPELIAKLAEVYSAAGDEDSAQVERAKLGSAGEGMGMGAGMAAAGVGAVGAAIAGVAMSDSGADAANELDSSGFGDIGEAPDVVQEFKETLPEGAADFDLDGDTDGLDDFDALGDSDGLGGTDALGETNELEDALQDINIDDEEFDLGDMELDVPELDAGSDSLADDLAIDSDELDIAAEVGLAGQDIDLPLDDQPSADSAADEFDLGLDFDLDESADLPDTPEVNASELREAFAGGNDLGDRNFVPESAEPLLGSEDVEPLDSTDDKEGGLLGGALAGVGAVAAAAGVAKSGIGEQLMDLVNGEQGDNDGLAAAALDDVDLDLGDTNLDIGSELSELDASLADDDLLGDLALDISGSEDSAVTDDSESSFSISGDLDSDLSDDLAADFSDDFASLDDSDDVGDVADGADLDMMDADETATKLDLARAFIEVGDADGAREILDEVIEEGSDDDQQQAKELLERIV